MQNQHELAQSDNGGPMEISVTDYPLTFWAQSLPNERDDDLSPVNSAEDDGTLNDLAELSVTREEATDSTTLPSRARHSAESDEESNDSPPTGRKKLRAALTGSQGLGKF